MVPSSGTQNVTIGYNEGFEVSSSLNPFCNFGFGIELQDPRTIKNLPNYVLDFLDLFASLRVPLQIFNFSIYPLARLGYILAGDGSKHSQEQDVAASLLTIPW